jgi:hypothetical protein
MRFVVTDLTRMSSGHICVAGLEEQSGSHVRPILARSQLSRVLYRGEGGPFAVGALIDLGSVTPRPVPPDVEDQVFREANVRRVRQLDPNEFWTAIDAASVTDLLSAFGGALTVHNASLVAPSGTGSASLAAWIPREPPEIWIRGDDVRCGFHLDGTLLDLKLNSLDLYDDAQRSPRRAGVDALIASLRRGDVRMSVGLTRAFRGFHWLQVNNIHVQPT